MLLQELFIIDSNEPFALVLTEASLRRTVASKCTGWASLIKFEAETVLRDSNARKARSWLTEAVAV